MGKGGFVSVFFPSLDSLILVQMLSQFLAGIEVGLRLESTTFF